VFLKDEEL